MLDKYASTDNIPIYLQQLENVIKNSTFNNNETCEFPSNKSHKKRICKISMDKTAIVYWKTQVLKMWNMKHLWVDFNYYKISSPFQVKLWNQHEDRGALDLSDINN